MLGHTGTVALCQESTTIVYRINARLYLHFLLRLRSLPSDSFRNTQLETLDLSHNEFQVTRSKILLTLYKLKLLWFLA